MKSKSFVMMVWLLALSCTGLAQINHVVPDTTVVIHIPDSTGSAYYHLDMDNNGSDDYYFKLELFYTTEFTPHEVKSFTSSVSGYNSNLVQVGPLMNGDLIDGSGNYTSTGAIYGWIPEFGGLRGSWAFDLPDPESEAYIGVRLEESGNYYFGWMKLKSDGKSLSLLEYAIRINPNQPINAGQY